MLPARDKPVPCYPAVDAALRYKRLLQHGYAVVRLMAHAFRLNLHVGGGQAWTHATGS